MLRGSAELREYLRSRDESPRKAVAVEKPRCTALPDGYTSLHLGGSPAAAPYLQYLSGRGLTQTQLGLYRIGYVDRGPLAGRVVVPSFDRNGLVNFWSARSIYPDARVRYFLPRASKDIVSNEHMVDWSQPVYLVEGIFDEIAIGPQAIALYGKLVFTELLMRLIERRPPVTYVCLDRDAKREARAILERLVGYDVKSALLDLPGKDPSELGGDTVMEISNDCAPVTGSIGLLESRL